MPQENQKRKNVSQFEIEPPSQGGGAQFEIEPPPPALPQRQPSAVSRFTGALAEQINPMAAARGLAQITSHPIDTYMNDVSARMDVHNKANQAWEAATNDWRQGHYLDAINHGGGSAIQHVYSMIPFLGPQINNAGEKFADGDLAGGIGQSTGIGLGMVGPKVLPKAIRGVGSVAGRAAGAVSDIVDPDITGILSPRLAHLQRVAGRVGNATNLPSGITPIWKLPEAQYTPMQQTIMASPSFLKTGTDAFGFNPEDVNQAIDRNPPAEVQQAIRESATSPSGQFTKRFQQQPLAWGPWSAERQGIPGEQQRPFVPPPRGATFTPNDATPALKIINTDPPPATYRMRGNSIPDRFTVTPTKPFTPYGLLPASTETTAATTGNAPLSIPESTTAINPLKAKTPQAAQTQVFKKLGIAAPGASAKPMTSIPSGAITPRPDLTFPRIIDPESAAMYQLSENVSSERLGINQLRAMAMQRGIPVEAADTHQILYHKLVNSLTDAERQQFENVLEDRAHIPDYSIDRTADVPSRSTPPPARFGKESGATAPESPVVQGVNPVRGITRAKAKR